MCYCSGNMKYNIPFKTSVLLSLSILFLWTCNPNGELELEPNPPLPGVVLDSISYLALGDSYTIGQGIAPSGRWPYQLGTRLSNSERIIDPIDIIARTGWTTNNLIQAIDIVDPAPYDLVSLLIGVNNQFQNRSFEEFQVEFDSLLNVSISIAQTKERVFVVSIPDYGVTPFGGSNRDKIAMELDAYNTFMEQQCQKQSIPFINITDISRTLGDGPGALAPDGLHPSADQYKAWVDRILPVVRELIND